MIYPAFQKTEKITGWIDFSPVSIHIDGYEKEFAASFCPASSAVYCKGEELYIYIKKENSQRTEYISEARRLTDEKCIITAEKNDDGLAINITVSCKKSLYRAMCRICQMLSDSRFFTGIVEDYPLFAERGYIEGFYGSPWSFENRKMMIALTSFYGMNTYCYAPKDDPYHRDKWDEIYPEKELSQLSVLSEICKEKFVDFYYCIAPGLSIKYTSESDFDKLSCKVKQLYSVGIRNFGLLLDDIHGFTYEEDINAYSDDIANAHIDLCNRFYDYIKSIDSACKLTVCPLQYYGKGDEYYISKLGKGLAGEIKLFWTGSNICSKELTVREAIIFENSTNRKPLYWDNFPVNDAEMQNEMHIGYINGRENDLYKYSRGIISNTMEYCLSSRIPLLTVCDYLWNPVSYDGYTSWQNACEIILGEQKEMFVPLFDNLLTSCLKVENSPMLNEYLNNAQKSFFSGDMKTAYEIISEYILKLDFCCKSLEILNNAQVKEVYPWLEKQKTALNLMKSAAMIFENNSEENKKITRNLLKEYLNHPKTLCDFSLQSFVERMLNL